MGQKVNPVGMRLGIIRQHDSRWFADKLTYKAQLHEDFRLRAYIEKQLAHASVSKVIIERKSDTDRIDIAIHTARPGMVIGQKGNDIDMLRSGLIKQSRSDKTNLRLDIIEVDNPDIDAKLVARSVARQLEGRISYRRALKKSIQSAVRQGAEGIRIQIRGRLGGAAIARTEWLREGRVPLHTLRADIDYATMSAYTTYGVIGVKVWVFKGEIIENVAAEAAPPVTTS
jgi:small subunit ribosomal protein S3